MSISQSQRNQADPLNEVPVSTLHTGTEPIMEVKHLSKYFVGGGLLTHRTVKAVEDVSFKLYPGKVMALVGESGSGKSTIARVLARLYDPTGGEVLFHGKPAFTDKSRRTVLDYRSKVQMIFQDPFSSLNPVHRVRHNLERPLLIHGKARGRAELEEKVGQLLNRVALTPPAEYVNKYPHQLSGGQRQRVAIARALAVQPEVMLADEPVSMLDVSIRIGILNLMVQLRDEEHIAFLYVTHDLATARYFADETMVMYAGRMVESGPSEEVIRQPQHPYTQLLLSAVPDPSRGLRTGDVDAPGEVPSLSTIEAGCPFAPRCPHVMAQCKTVMPPITALDDTHWVRCHIFSSKEAAQVPKQPASAPDRVR